MKYLVFSLLLFNQLYSQMIILKSPKCTIHSISEKNLKYLFLGKKNLIENDSIIPLNTSNSDLFHNFSKYYLGKSINQINTYWARMLFTGRKQPPAIVDFNKKYLDKCYLTYSNKLHNNWDKIEIIK